MRRLVVLLSAVAVFALVTSIRQIRANEGLCVDWICDTDYFCQHDVAKVKCDLCNHDDHRCQVAIP